MGFNPYRVFKFVATPEDYETHFPSVGFQSLSGFQVRCNATAGEDYWVGTWFQSLSGFQVRCNSGCEPFLGKATAVSIPIGFSSSLQQKDRFQIDVENTVSIPIGFSSSLQREGWALQGGPWFVSIPIGFSSSLQRLSPGMGGAKNCSFQSLSGFQVRCNSRSRDRSPWRMKSFNPYRVFKFVATLPTGNERNDAGRGFNPYRVFKFVATEGIRMTPQIHDRFQSLSGFQVRCNILSRRPTVTPASR